MSCRDLREVQHDRRPELDVGLKDAGRGGGREARRGACGSQARALPRTWGAPSSFAGRRSTLAAGVLGPVHPVTEAHQAALAVEDGLHVPFGVARPLDLLDHCKARGSVAPAVAACPDSAPTAPDSAAATSAPVEAITRCGERGGEHNRSRAASDPVGVQGLHVPWIPGSPRQRGEEGLGGRLRLATSSAAGIAGSSAPRAGLRDEREQLRAGPVRRPRAPARGRCRSNGRRPHRAAERRHAALRVHPHVAGADWEVDRLVGRQARGERGCRRAAPRRARRTRGPLVPRLSTPRVAE